jgi:hypothetical protein
MWTKSEVENDAVRSASKSMRRPKETGRDVSQFA